MYLHDVAALTYSEICEECGLPDIERHAGRMRVDAVIDTLSPEIAPERTQTPTDEAPRHNVRYRKCARTDRRGGTQKSPSARDTGLNRS